MSRKSTPPSRPSLLEGLHQQEWLAKGQEASRRHRPPAASPGNGDSEVVAEALGFDASISQHLTLAMFARSSLGRAVAGFGSPFSDEARGAKGGT